MLRQGNGILLHSAALGHALGHHVHLGGERGPSARSRCGLRLNGVMAIKGIVLPTPIPVSLTVFFWVSVAVMPVLSPSVKASSMSLSSMVLTIHSTM